MTAARFAGNGSGLVTTCPTCLAVVRCSDLDAHILAAHPAPKATARKGTTKKEASDG